MKTNVVEETRTKHRDMSDSKKPMTYHRFLSGIKKRSSSPSTDKQVHPSSSVTPPKKVSDTSPKIIIKKNVDYEQDSERITKTVTQQLKPIRKNFDAGSNRKKIEIIEDNLDIDLEHIKKTVGNLEHYRGNVENIIGLTTIPIGLAGPVFVNGAHAKGHYFVPMATTEGALTMTYTVGAKLTNLSGGIKTQVDDNIVHISPLFVTQSQQELEALKAYLDTHFDEIRDVAQSTTNHGKLIRIEQDIMGLKLICKFCYQTGDAQGLNMINRATYAACRYIREKKGIQFHLRSHYSGVKHYSLMNKFNGYGRKVTAYATIPSRVMSKMGVTPTMYKDYARYSIMAGHKSGIQNVNVHAANAIAAIFTATGQDIADLSSSHICSSYCDVIQDDEGEKLFLQIVLPNLLVATVGGGTSIGTQRECLSMMKCAGSGKADKLAEIIAATVLAGELITVIALITEQYVQGHDKYTVKRD